MVGGVPEYCSDRCHCVSKHRLYAGLHLPQRCIAQFFTSLIDTKPWPDQAVAFPAKNGGKMSAAIKIKSGGGNMAISRRKFAARFGASLSALAFLRAVPGHAASSFR
jgi:hypothetical protein